jgi:hypothetical protein
MKLRKWAPAKLKKLSLTLFFIYLVSSYSTSLYFVRDTAFTATLARYALITIVALAFYTVWYLLASIYSDAFAYAKTIKGSKEQPAFVALAQGTLGLFISLALTAFINIIRIPPVGNTIYQFLTIALYFGSGIMTMYYFFYIGKAGYILAKYVKRQSAYRNIYFISLAVIGFFCALVWHRITSQSFGALGIDHIFKYISTDVLFYTLLVPLIFIWSFGLAGAYGFYAFLHYSRGVIYKHAFVSITAGVVALVVMSVSRHMADYFSGSASQSTLSHDFLRILALFTLAILSMLFISRGLRNLMKIEKVSK